MLNFKCVAVAWVLQPLALLRHRILYNILADPESSRVRRGLAEKPLRLRGGANWTLRVSKAKACEAVNLPKQVYACLLVVQPVQAPKAHTRTPIPKSPRTCQRCFRT